MGWGSFTHRGGGRKVRALPRKFVFLGFRTGIWDVPGILLGCPGPLGVFKKFVQKKFVRISRSLIISNMELLRQGRAVLLWPYSASTELPDSMHTGSGARQHCFPGRIKITNSPDVQRAENCNGLALDSVAKQKHRPNRQKMSKIGSKQKGPAEQVAPRVSSLKICRF